MANVTQQHLDVTGYGDTLLWNKAEHDDGSISKEVIFPISRYVNMLNRPRVVEETSSLAITPNANFHLVTTNTEEVDDDTIFSLFGQIW